MKPNYSAQLAAFALFANYLHHTPFHAEAEEVPKWQCDPYKRRFGGGLSTKSSLNRQKKKEKQKKKNKIAKLSKKRNRK